MLLERLQDKLAAPFLAPGAQFSLSSLAAALAIGAAVLLMRRGKPLELRVLLRALFPRRFFRHASARIDAGYLLINTFVYGSILGGAVFSFEFAGAAATGVLTAVFGAKPAYLPEPVARASVTLLLFLGYEFGYWLDHYLKHRVPALWELHKVHHSAEVLTPLTAARVHPLDTLIFVNILALTAALFGSLGAYLFGAARGPYALSGNNILLVLFMHLYVHLQHTELWIPFRGVWGRLFLSPAHHQIHHSADAKHFNTNFGSCLALFDWMFGTLHMPAAAREKLAFGVAPYPLMHTLTGELVSPVGRSARAFLAFLAACRRGTSPRADASERI